MPTPRKRFDLYPPEYIELFRRAVTLGRAAVPLSSREECARLRNLLYGLRDKLLAERDYDPALSAHVPNVRFKIETTPSLKGATLILEHSNAHRQRPAKCPYFRSRAASR